MTDQRPGSTRAKAVVLAILVGLAPVPWSTRAGPPGSGLESRAVAAQVEHPAPPEAPGPHAVGVARHTFTRVSSMTAGPRMVDTIIWYPAVADSASPDPILAGTIDAGPERNGAPFPILLWSHGNAHPPWASSFFSAHLASHGFVVVAPSHEGRPLVGGPFPARHPELADPGRPVDVPDERPPDIDFALDETLGVGAAGDPILAGLLDPDRIGMAGHSRGAGTALRVVAADRRFRAAIPMAPAATGVTRLAVRKIGVPMMLMGGKLDELSPFMGQQQLFGLSRSTSRERWLVGFPHGGHSAFVDQCSVGGARCATDWREPERVQVLIKRWGVAFLLRHVALDDRYAALLDPTLADGDPDIEIAVRLPGGSG